MQYDDIQDDAIVFGGICPSLKAMRAMGCNLPFNRGEKTSIAREAAEAWPSATLAAPGHYAKFQKKIGGGWVALGVVWMTRTGRVRAKIIDRRLGFSA